MSQMESPYFAEVAAKIRAEATRQGYIMLLDATGAAPTVERRVLDGCGRTSSTD